MIANLLMVHVEDIWLDVCHPLNVSQVMLYTTWNDTMLYDVVYPYERNICT